MARDHGRIRWSIWADPDFLALREAEQRLYLLALSQSGLSYAGVVPFTLRRWEGLAADSAMPKLRKAAAGLAAARFVVTDDATEELLVRGFVRNDGLLDSPNVCRSFARDYRAVCSPLLRAVIVCECVRMLGQDPRPGNERSWNEVLIPWLAETLPRIRQQTFSDTDLETIAHACGKPALAETLDETLGPARAAPSPSITPTPRRARPHRADRSASAWCEVHRQDEPCTGCAADRKAGARGSR